MSQATLAERVSATGSSGRIVMPTATNTVHNSVQHQGAATFFGMTRTISGEAAVRKVLWSEEYGEAGKLGRRARPMLDGDLEHGQRACGKIPLQAAQRLAGDRKSTRLNSSH